MVFVRFLRVKYKFGVQGIFVAKNILQGEVRAAVYITMDIIQ